MDIKRIVTSLLFALALVFLMQYVFGGFGGGSAATGPAVFEYYWNIPAYKTPDQYAARQEGAMPEQRVLGEIHASGSKDKLAVIINNVTAGIDQVQLRDYNASVGKKDKLVLFRSLPGKPKPFATLGVHVTPKGETKEIGYGLVHEDRAGKTVSRELVATDSADVVARANATALLDRQFVWKFGDAETTPTSSKISLYMTLQRNGKDAIRITKTFELLNESYDLTVSHTVENLTGEEMAVSIDQLGAPELPRDDPSMDDRIIMATRLDTAQMIINPKGLVTVAHLETARAFNGWKDAKGILRDVGTKPIGVMSSNEPDPFLWVAADNRFFTTLVRPKQDPATSGTFTLSSPAGVLLTKQTHVEYASLDLIEVVPGNPKEDVIMMRFRGAKTVIPPMAGETPGNVTMPMAVFAGPKKKDLLEGSYTPVAPGTPAYDHAAFSYHSVVQFNTCFLYNFCVFDGLVYGILGLLDFLYRTIAFHNYGIAIMILVIIVRALLHPLTRASQISMAKMGKMMRDVQPKVEAIKKRYPAPKEREKQTQEMMKLYREHNINPAGGIMGCLPMLLQLPIWAALMSGLRLDIDLRHAMFIPGWIPDLSNPDTIFPRNPQLGHPLFTIPLLNFEVYGFNPLPILLAVVLFYNMKITMASQPKPADEQQAQMQKWSMYSIFMLPLFLYNASSGSNLYFFASTLGGIVDTYFIRKSLKKRGILPPSAKDLPVAEPKK